jgi:hypothetical protein
LEQASEPFVGKWQGLISTTNWEKGHIICAWRQALIDAEAPVSEYADETWARLVGSVTAQHVGRLRRVHERFGETQAEYQGLYWSHFHAAIDWDDAEMWLEGALQNGWSVSQMRRQRWETLGSLPNDKPQDVDIVTAELDEDYSADTPADNIVVDTVAEVVDTNESDASSTKSSESRERKSPDSGTEGHDADGAAIFSDEPEKETIEFVRPFEKLAELPDDVTEAFEAFKLAILRHKMDGWQEVSRDDVLASLDALKELALAPSDEGSF